MSLTFDAEIGGVAANSYATVEEANAYLAGRIGALAWGDQDLATKEMLLVAATERLEVERWRGAKATSAQRLKWPRAFVDDPDPSAEAIEAADYGTYPVLPSDIIPRGVVSATAELAWWLLQQGLGTDAFAPTGLEQFRRLKVGALEIERDTDVPGAAATLPDAVRLHLRGLRAPRTPTRLARA